MILYASVYVYVFVLIIKKLDFLYIYIERERFIEREREIKALVWGYSVPGLPIILDNFASEFGHLWCYR